MTSPDGISPKEKAHFKCEDMLHMPSVPNVQLADYELVFSEGLVA